MRYYRKIKPETGFTNFEIIISLALFVIIIMMTGSMFTISQRTYNAGSTESELTQNARVAVDRMSREIRQSQNMVTSIASSSDSANNEIFFQDGHDTSNTTYIRYYLDGTNLMRTHEAYYFNSNPSLYVIWNGLDQYGNTTTKVILDASDNIVGEYFQSLKFWGSRKLINISLTLQKGLKTLNFDSMVFTRN